MAEYEILLQSPTGVTLGSLHKIESCTYGRTENDAGEISLVVPDLVYDPSWFQPFNRVLIQRQVGGGTPIIDLQTPWFLLDSPIQSLAADGTRLLTFEGTDALGLILGGANIAYNDYNSYTYKLDYADDMLREIFKENRGSLATDSNRDFSSLIIVGPDVSSAPIIRMGSFARQQMLNVFQDIANASANDDTPTWLGFDVILNDSKSGLLEFTTYIGQRGTDHRSPNGSPPLLLTPNTGTLANVTTGQRFRGAASFIYAGAAAVADIRAIATAQNDIFRGRSPFARIEKYVDGGQIVDPIALEAFADAELRRSRPQNFFEGELIETNNLLRGIHWDYGDYLTAEWNNRTYDVRASKIAVSLEAAQGGGLIETSKALLRGEEFLSG